jgi:hypothetical protein
MRVCERIAAELPPSAVPPGELRNAGVVNQRSIWFLENHHANLGNNLLDLPKSAILNRT